MMMVRMIMMLMMMKNSLVPDCWMSLTDFFSFIKPSLSWARACKYFCQLGEIILQRNHPHHFIVKHQIISVVKQMGSLIVHGKGEESEILDCKKSVKMFSICFEL